MSFNCNIRFTGLCAFVPNSPLDATPPPERMCVVLVDGRKDGTKGVDGTKLRRHRAFVLFDVRNLPPGTGQPKNGQGIWYMEDQRIVIDTDGAGLDTSSYNAAIDANHDISSPPAGTETSLSWVAGLTKLMPLFASLDKDCVSIDDVASPVPKSVLAQIFFNKGILTTIQPASQVWSVSSVLSTESTRQPFAHEVLLTLTGVTKLKFVGKALPRPNAQDDTLELVPGTLGSVEITVANLCEDNPLGWPRSPNPKDDEDFKWYYELMTSAQQGTINKKRRGAPLPTPLPERKKISPAATGVNCFPVRAADIGFVMP